MMLDMKIAVPLSFFVSMSLLATGCLKTRAQLKEDEAEDRKGPSKPVPTQVEEVQPQGRYVIDELKSEITRITGRIEDLERNQRDQASAGANANREELKKLETRIIELEQAQAAMLDAIKKMQAQPPAPAAAAESEDLYKKSQAQYQAGNYEAAVETLNGYLKNPKAKHTEDATFLRGDAYFGLKQYKKAIIDYAKFPEKYSHSKKVPMALWKIGQSFEALNMKAEAKGFYQELLEKFPKSAEAKKAKKKVK
jgi:tol-pal system protein YbgF